MTFGVTSHVGMVFSDTWPVKNEGQGIAWMSKTYDSPFFDLVQNYLHPTIVAKEAMVPLPTVSMGVCALYSTQALVDFLQ